MPVALGGPVVNLFWPRVKQPAVGIWFGTSHRLTTRKRVVSHRSADSPRPNDEDAAPRVGFAAVHDTGRSGERKAQLPIIVVQRN